MSGVPFCTCSDFGCPFHPTNHDNGCTPCIAKNLREREIPTCFFKTEKENLGKLDDYSFESFCRLVREGAQTP